jgi:hypothetical protein
LLTWDLEDLLDDNKDGMVSDFERPRPLRTVRDLKCFKGRVLRRVGDELGGIGMCEYALILSVNGVKGAFPSGKVADAGPR